VGTEGKENLVHLERSWQRLDENGGLNGASRQTARLQLRKIEIRARALRKERRCVMEKEEAEVDQRARCRATVDEQVTLGQVQASS
jgi:hypothetical protein